MHNAVVILTGANPRPASRMKEVVNGGPHTHSLVLQAPGQVRVSSHPSLVRQTRSTMWAEGSKLAKMHSEGPVIDQVLEEFLTEQEERLALRTYGQYETVIELLREYLERYVTPSDPALAKAVDEAHRTGTEYAVCGLCPPREIVDNIDDFLSWFMVRKVLAGQNLMRAAGTVTRRLGKWLYEHNYIGGDDATVYQDETTRLSRSLPKAKALRDKVVQWVDGLPKMKSEKTYDGHF